MTMNDDDDHDVAPQAEIITMMSTKLTTIHAAKGISKFFHLLNVRITLCWHLELFHITIMEIIVTSYPC